MTRTAGLPLGVVKEIRALSVAWLACLVTMLAAAAMSAGQFRSLGVTAYFLGAAALGAVSIGHEYSHRTLTMLLAQPARRERLLLTKLGVLLVMLLLLCTVAAVVLFNASGSLRAPRSLLQRDYVLWALWLPVLGGLIVAPWLTMLFRNPIAGALFTVVIPGMLVLAGELLGMAVYGRFAPEVDGFGLAFFRTSALGLCAIGAVMGWRTFMRLEAIDGRDPDLRLPGWLRWSTAPAAGQVSVTRHPLWQLAVKELRLQQMSFAMAALYAAGGMAFVLSIYVGVARDDDPAVLSIIYAFLLSLLIGSLASADERRLGTLEWQLVLPVAASTQWAVKVATALSLTILLAIGLPVLVAAIAGAMQTGSPARLDIAQLSVAVLLVVVTCGSLYVSSLSTSGIQALLISAAALPVVSLLVLSALGPLGVFVLLRASRLAGELAGPASNPRLFSTALALLLIAAFLAVVLRFAMTNHHSAERGTARLAKQLIWIAACLTIGVIVWAVLTGVGQKID